MTGVVRSFAVVAGMLAAVALAGCGNTPTPSGGQTGPQPAAAAPSAAVPAVYIGMSTNEVPIDSTTNGARIDFLYPGGPAETAGLREGDVVTSLNGKSAPSNANQIAVLAGVAAGTAVSIEIRRNGQPMTVEVTPAARPPDYTARFYQAINDRIDREDQDAADAQAKHASRSAFDHYVVALRLMGMTPNHEQRYTNDLTQVAAILPKLKPAPGIPETVQIHGDRAVAMLQNAHSDVDNDRAANEFGLAILEAPWVADLYRNYGLIRAKAGEAWPAVVNFNDYLILDPGARDAAVTRQKMEELAPLAADQKPWARFLGDHPMAAGEVERLFLRRRTLILAMVKPPPPPDPESALRAGDPICAGTINGSQFQGQCVFVDPDQRFLGCFGGKKEFPADGSIDGDTFRINAVTYIHYHSESCVIDSEKRGEFRTIAASH